MRRGKVKDHNGQEMFLPAIVLAGALITALFIGPVPVIASIAAIYVMVLVNRKLAG